jgi:outer membrane receptor protein involved in Fe transport
VEYDGRLSNAFAVNAGLRHEHKALQVIEGTDQVRSSYSLFAPSLHASYRFDDAGKRQLRASLARTFNAPFLDQLRQRPSQINALAACTPGQLCGPNTADLADVAGNPMLRPERAFGINFSFEQQWGNDSRVRVEAFSRSIRDVFVTETQLESVPWASAPRYVARPENRGHAEVRGVGLESSFRLNELLAGWPNLKFRTGVNWARSHLADVPGPDNRFAGQNPWSAKLGVDYAPPGAAWDCGLSASASPAGWVRNALNQRYFESRRNEIGADASWTQSAQLKWRLSLRNLVPKDSTRIDEFEQNSGFTTRSVVKRNAASVQFGAELRL